MKIPRAQRKRDGRMTMTHTACNTSALHHDSIEIHLSKKKKKRVPGPNTSTEMCESDWNGKWTEKVMRRGVDVSSSPSGLTADWLSGHQSSAQTSSTRKNEAVSTPEVDLYTATDLRLFPFISHCPITHFLTSAPPAKSLPLKTTPPMLLLRD